MVSRIKILFGVLFLFGTIANAQLDSNSIHYEVGFGLNALPYRYFPHEAYRYYNMVINGYHFEVGRISKRFRFSMGVDANSFNNYKDKSERQIDNSFALSTSSGYNLIKPIRKWKLLLGIELFGNLANYHELPSGWYTYKEKGVYAGFCIELGRRFLNRWEWSVTLDDSWGYYKMKSNDGQLLASGYDSRPFHEPLLCVRYRFDRISFKKAEK